jgi:hypothetical protein
MQAIETNLRSDNPVVCRVAALACRNTLEDVARTYCHPEGTATRF